MRFLFILVGFPGAGKSLLAYCLREWMENNGLPTFIVSKDNIREMLYGKYVFNPTTEDLVRVLTKKLVGAMLDQYNVIVDETMVLERSRKTYIDYRLHTSVDGEKIQPIMIWCTENERNEFRRMTGGLRGVPATRWNEVISGMRNIFEPPDSKKEFCPVFEVKDVAEFVKGDMSAVFCGLLG